MPNLRATTSKDVTHAMMTISHPDVRAIHSSGRRKASESFNNALIVSAPVTLRIKSSLSIARRNPPLPHGPEADARRAGRSIGGSWRGRIPLTGGWPAQPEAAPGVRLLAAQIGRLDDLCVAPDGVLLAEGEVVVGDFFEG